jgi:hypothetical protein
MNIYEKLRKVVYQKIYPKGIPLEVGCEFLYFRNEDIKKYGKKAIENNKKRKCVILDIPREGIFYPYKEMISPNKEIISPRIKEIAIGEKESIDILGKPLELQDILRMFSSIRVPDTSMSVCGAPDCCRLFITTKKIWIFLNLQKPIKDQEPEELKKIYNLIK